MIGLHPPYIKSSALKYLKKCISKGWVSTSGDYVDKFEETIKKFTGAKYAIAFNSGTSALHISLKLAGVSEGDEVIAPTVTFVATINSIIYNLCRPVFMDCDEYYNIDAKKTLCFLSHNTFIKNNRTYNKKTNKRISAIIITHVWGNAADTLELIAECKSRNINVVEDASESLGTRYKLKKKHTGTLGLFGVFSFNANKIITTGSGGMIVTNNHKLALKAKYLSTQAKDDSIYFIHNEVGYNYRMSNISAAIGFSQISQIKKIIYTKKKIREFYKKKINCLNNLKIASTPKYSLNNNWLNILQLSDKIMNKRNYIIRELIKNKINVRPIWKLNHQQKQFKKYETYKINNAQDLVKRSICLPSSAVLKNKDLNKIVKKIKSINQELFL